MASILDVTNANRAASVIMSILARTHSGLLFTHPQVRRLFNNDEGTLQLTSTDVLRLYWNQPADADLNAVAAEIASVATAGDVQLNLYDVMHETESLPGGGEPITPALVSATVSVGADGNQILSFSSAERCYANNRYCLEMVPQGDTDFSIRYRAERIDATGKAFTPGVRATFSEDNGENFSNLTIYDAAVPACPELILNPDANGGPQLYYGRYLGDQITMPGGQLMTIPAAGVPIPAAGAGINYMQFVYVANVDDALSFSFSTTGYNSTNGEFTKRDDTTKKLIGAVRFSPYNSAPAVCDAPDLAYVSDAYHPERLLYCPNPYWTNSGSFLDLNTGAWQDWHASHWDISFILATPAVTTLAAAARFGGDGTVGVSASIEVDDTGAPHPSCDVAQVHGSSYFWGRTTLPPVLLAPGFHRARPLGYCSGSGQVMFNYDSSLDGAAGQNNRASFYGRILGHR